ncbi:MAG: hypothetical protein F6K48_28390, partial [Okeania sp. SIO3H1]|nr:hypothetical protein [Okeania sp. SIO3H1]
MHNRFTQEDNNVPNEATNRYNSLRPWNFFTQQVNNVLELAFDEAKHLNHREIGPVHLLLGLIRQEQGLAAQVLRSAGVKLENARLSRGGVFGGQLAVDPERDQLVDQVADGEDDEELHHPGGELGAHARGGHGLRVHAPEIGHEDQ